MNIEIRDVVEVIDQQIRLFEHSFKNANVETRTELALSKEEVKAFYTKDVKETQCAGLLVQTCNRRLFLVHGEQVDLLQQRIQSVLNRASETMEVKHGNDAMRYFLRVMSGMESQIYGDAEIAGQVRKSFFQAKEYGCISGLLEKVATLGIHTSRMVKRIDPSTFRSHSVSLATAQLLKIQSPKNILIVGTGEIGKRVIHHVSRLEEINAEVGVANRTSEKAEEVAESYGCKMIPFTSWKRNASSYDAIVLALHSDEPVLTKEVVLHPDCHIYDLGIPSNVQSVQERIHVMNVDSISEAYNAIHNAQVAMSQRDHDHIIDAAMEALQRWSKARRAKDLVDGIGIQSEYYDGLPSNSSLAHVFFSKVKAEPQVCVAKLWLDALTQNLDEDIQSAAL